MTYMENENANIMVPGRQTQYKIPDVMGEGINNFMMEKMRSGGFDDDVGVDALEDGEVEDDGDLDV